MKPVWMSRARSVPAFIVENSAPWMNGTASANARNESVGKPGSSVEACRPAAFTVMSAIGKTSGGDHARGLACRATTERRAIAPTCGQAAAHGRRGGSASASSAAPSSVRPVFARNTSSSDGRLQLEVDDVDAVRIDRAHDVGRARGRPGAARRRHASWRAARRTARGTRRSAARSSSRPGIACTLGRPISAFSSAGVPSATILPVVDDPDPVGEDVRLLQVLRREEDGDAILAPQAGDLLPERRPALRVEAGRRLVEEEDPRAVDEREREVEPALHPARVAGHLPVGRVLEPDALEQVVGPNLTLRSFGTPWSVACSLRWSRPVRSGSSAASCSATPISERTFGPSLTTSYPPTRAVPEVGGSSVVRTWTVVDLPGAVRPEEAVDLTRRDGEVDPVDRARTLLVLANEPQDLDPVCRLSTVQHYRRPFGARPARGGASRPPRASRCAGRRRPPSRSAGTCRRPRSTSTSSARTRACPLLSAPARRRASAPRSEVAPLLLRHAVHVDLERPRDVGRKADAGSSGARSGTFIEWQRGARHALRPGRSASAAVALAPVALADNGGFAPVAPESPNAERIRDTLALRLDLHRRDLRARRGAARHVHLALPAAAA